jgi:hypothetical protein
MPKISLDLRRIDFRSDQNTNLIAWRIEAETLFTTPTGRIVPYSCIVDTGAPVSVLPFWLWHDCNLKWRPLGTQVLRHGSKAFESLKWRRVNCSLGDTSVYLFDGQVNLQAGPFSVVGKFANRRQLDPNLEMIARLGMSFLTDNDLELIVDGTAGSLSAQFFAP